MASIELSEIEKNVFEKFKIVEVSAEDCSDGLLYILAPNVNMAEEKAKLMTHRGINGREVGVSEEIRQMRYYDDAIKWAENHEIKGHANCDAFWFNSFRDWEAEEKQRKEEKAKQEFYKMLLWPLVPK